MSYKVVTTATTIYASRAGITTYSDTAGISTSVIGGIGSVTNFIVSGIATLGVTSTTQFTSKSINVSGIITSTGGFISVANTTPVTIKIENGLLVFSAVGIGSTSFTLA